MLYCAGEPLIGASPVPVTAKLSRKFYETFGDEIANELVEWFNQVDATYRADLLQINELNFSRFDARLEQRVAQVQAKLEQRMGQLESRLQQRMAQFESKLEQRITQVESELDLRIAKTRAELIKWMFVFWVGTLVPLGGLLLFLVR
jgi:ABC-type phosphate transport system auxiliary subunit